jgi:hypothetical protein
MVTGEVADEPQALEAAGTAVVPSLKGAPEESISNGCLPLAAKRSRCPIIKPVGCGILRTIPTPQTLQAAGTAVAHSPKGAPEESISTFS